MGEKFLWGKFLEKLPAAVRHVYALVLIIIGWVLFRSGSLAQVGQMVAAMFGAAPGRPLAAGNGVLSPPVPLGAAAGHSGIPARQAGAGGAAGRPEGQGCPGAADPGTQGTGLRPFGLVRGAAAQLHLPVVPVFSVLRGGTTNEAIC